jgi:hypothetical protein
VLYDDERDEVLAEGHTLPCAWDGTVAGLGQGIDHIIRAGFVLREAGGPANALSAPAADVVRSAKNEGSVRGAWRRSMWTGKRTQVCTGSQRVGRAPSRHRRLVLTCCDEDRA